MKLAVMAAGRGSRFLSKGIATPKPLVKFHGRPLFWWAVESALSGISFDGLYFAVLRDHVLNHQIDKVILSYYPNATINILDEVTSGAAQTASIMAKQINDTDQSIVFIDSDLAFEFEEPPYFVTFDDSSENKLIAGLCVFQSKNPAYSYLEFDVEGKVLGTVEKMVVSDKAIAGAYFFSSVKLFLSMYEGYEEGCPYNELYMSGLYNEIINKGGEIIMMPLKTHLSLGTPEELLLADSQSLDCLRWFHNAV
jgi:NDP-sugar pyrophosphorylase family protein